MIRIGLVDFDTSHVVEFTKRFNHVDVDEALWVEGGKVVMGYPGTSQIAPAQMIQDRVALLGDKYGVQIVDRPEDMIGHIDAVCIESVDGSVHLERARPFLDAGIPMYVDKPFTCSLAEAKELVVLAEQKNVPLFSTSSLRYGKEVMEVKAKEAEYGKVVGADCYSPASLHPRNPGLFHYGIHGVEPLYALMGRGCKEVQCVFQEGAEVATGVWSDGRIGTVRGTRDGAHSYGFTAFCEKTVIGTAIDATWIYYEMLKRIMEMFQTRMAPIDIRETVEIVAFIEAALKSARNGGQRTALEL
ncbi:MAG: Gfo/Idh/MocA family oxidoreductase [Armatimonadetes bacterium]|nr:Gfo/Idh/MocA family oxidoreductase [Armatimonadota bacterium]